MLKESERGEERVAGVRGWEQGYGSTRATKGAEESKGKRARGRKRWMESEGTKRGNESKGKSARGGERGEENAGLRAREREQGNESEGVDSWSCPLLIMERCIKLYAILVCFRGEFWVRGHIEQQKVNFLHLKNVFKFPDDIFLSCYNLIHKRERSTQ